MYKSNKKETTMIEKVMALFGFTSSDNGPNVTALRNKLNQLVQSGASISNISDKEERARLILEMDHNAFNPYRKVA